MIDTPKILELLENSPLFRGIPRRILSSLTKKSMQISLHQGQQLLSPGMTNEHVFIILTGQLSIHLTLSNQDEPIAILNPGECVGEMSVLVDRSVSAFAIANTDCQLLAIGYSSFWALIKDSNDAALNMLNILVKRIRTGNEVIADVLLHEDNAPSGKTLIDNRTGLYNRHGMQEKYDRMLHLCTVNRQPLCLILLKIDEEKNPHNAGKNPGDEQPLHAIAQTMLTFLRQDDHAARLSGNTFCILLANLALPDVKATAERLRATIGRLPIGLPDGSSLPPVTISAGICNASEDDSWDTLLHKASQALERAVRAGGNRIAG